MATLATQTIRRNGLAPAYVGATGGGDACTPGAKVFLHAKNGSGAPITVTVDAVSIPEPDMQVTDLAVSVPAGGERMIGPIDAPTFAQPSTGLANITYSGVTSLTIGAFDVAS